MIRQHIDFICINAKPVKGCVIYVYDWIWMCICIKNYLPVCFSTCCECVNCFGHVFITLRAVACPSFVSCPPDQALRIHMAVIFQCMRKIFCVEFQRVPLKFYIKYLPHTLKETSLYNGEIVRALRFKSSDDIAWTIKSNHDKAIYIIMVDTVYGRWMRCWLF